MEEFDVELLYLEYLETAEELGPERVDQHLRQDRLNSLSDVQFILKYRLSKDVVVKLVTEIEDVLEFATARNFPFTPTEQVLIGLRFFACSSFQIVMRDIGNVSKSTIFRCIINVASALAGLRPTYMTMPHGKDLEDIKQEFYTKFHFPDVVGAIDCTHVPIISPGGPNKELFKNSKGYFSINVQTVSDSNLLIRDIEARWPGSFHDSTVFDNSHLRRLFEENRFQSRVLLGDSGYELRPYLITPFLNATTVEEERFNLSHSEARNTVESTYAAWKCRFPALSLGLRTKLEKTLKVIVATAVLHNIAVQTKDVLPPEDEELHQFLTQNRLTKPQYMVYEEVSVSNIEENEVEPGTNVRSMIVRDHFS